MKKLIITIGESSTGKTTVAKNYTKENNAMYLDFDALFSYANLDNPPTFLKKIKSLIDASDNHSFVLDGYSPRFLPTPAHLGSELGVEIEWHMCIAAPHIITKRQKAKARDPLHSSPTPEATIRRTTESIFALLTSTKAEAKLIDTSGNNVDVLPLSSFTQRWQELLLLSDLEKATYDKGYQDIWLPSGISVSGYSDSRKTWERLSSVVDFKNKSVLDVGCFHGFFSFKAEEAGARKIVGWERDPNVKDTAHRIAWIKNSKACFQIGDIDYRQSDEVFDIVLVLNMIHHVKDMPQALKHIFEAGRNVIFEIGVKDEPTILEQAKLHGFLLDHEMSSHRSERKILLMKRSHVAEGVFSTPAEKFKFNPNQYRKDRLKKSIKSMPIFYPIKYLVKGYRRYKKSSDADR